MTTPPPPEPDCTAPNGGYYSPDRVGARVTELMRKAGIQGTSLRSLRHTHTSELLSKGVPPPTVAKRLGHANASITLSIYAHPLEAMNWPPQRFGTTPWRMLSPLIGANRRGC